MSYRALKRLLGETSLERKCRFLFGAFILLLISGSFWLYAHQTEDLAYEQIPTACRPLVHPILAKKHADKGIQDVLDKYQDKQETNAAEPLPEYYTRIIKPSKPSDPSEESVIKEFQADPSKPDSGRLVQVQGENSYHYYAAIRAGKACLGCHQQIAEESNDRQAAAELSEDDLMAVVHIRMKTSAIERGMHWNRAVLISTALVTALLIMTGSYIIVRYVIVKPVKHLKE